DCVSILIVVDGRSGIADAVVSPTVCIKGLPALVIVYRAVQLVGSSFSHDVDGAAVGVAVRGIEHRGLNLYFLHGIGRGDKDDYAAAERHSVGDSIHHELVIAGLRAAAAIDTELSLRIAGVGPAAPIHAGRQ